MKTYMVLGHRVKPLPTGDGFSLVEIVSAPSVPGPPPHLHEDATEFFYIVDGELAVMCDGEWQTLRSGDSLSLKPGQIHTFVNNSERDVRWLTGWTPRGFEQFFEDFGVDDGTEDAFQESCSTNVLQSVAARAREYGMVFVDEREKRDA